MKETPPSATGSLIEAVGNACNVAGPWDHEWNMRFRVALLRGGARIDSTPVLRKSSDDGRPAILCPRPVDGPGRWPMPSFIVWRVGHGPTP
jgi:hypothetical protein